jgi:hypothetical protein
MPRLLPAGEQRRICMARRQTGWEPRLLMVRTGHPHSTISNVLKRNGLSQLPRVARALAVFAARGVAAKAADDRQRLGVHEEPLAARAPRSAWRPPPDHGSAPAAHQREWAYGLRYRSSRYRGAALPHWLRLHDERRPHSSLGGLPPISRVHNVYAQDS